MSDKELIIAAANLARRAPEEWRAFLSTFDTYVGQKMGDCIAAPIDMLPVAQGRAQLAVQLSQLLKDCIKTSDTIERKRGP